MKLRPLEPGDMEALTELARRCDETYLEWTPPGWIVPVAPPRWADRYLRDDAWARVAFEDDALIATVAFRAETERLAHVGLVFVRPSHWRRGIAARMLGVAEREMRSRGFVREQLWTPLGAPAERFYASQGWRPDGRRQWHPWVGLELVGYAKDLSP